jgi:general secretion pathway protein C
MLARWWTFGVWALVAGSALFWGLRVFVQAPEAPRGTVVAQPGGDVRGDLTRLFGVDAPPPQPLAAEAATVANDPRYTLVGVLSPRNAGAAREGVALIAIDGNPAKAFRVGHVIDGNTVLQTVSARGAQLGPRGGPTRVALELPPLPVAATGTLPSIGGQGVTGPGRPPMGMPPGAAGFNPSMQAPPPQDGGPPPDNAQNVDAAPLR